MGYTKSPSTVTNSPSTGYTKSPSTGYTKSPASTSYTPSPAGFSLTSLDVSSGTEAGGTTITATGVGLTGTTGVTINGVACTSVTVVNDTTVTFVTPAATFALSSTAASNAKDVVLTAPLGSGTLTGGYRYTSEFARLTTSLYVSEYRANDPAITLNAGNVATWPDYAGTNPLTQATASKQPAFEATGFNGGPSILGDGVNDALTNTSVTGLATAKRPYMLIAVQRVGGTNVTVSTMVSATGNNVDTFEYSAGGWQTTRNDDSGVQATDGFGAFNANRNLFEHGFTAGGTAGLVAFGNPLSTTRTGSTDEALTRIGVLGDAAGSANANARVVAVLVLGDEPSAGLKTSLRTAFHAAMWIGYTSSSLSLT